MKNNELTLEKLLAKREELHPDLKSCIQPYEDLLILRHSLVSMVPYSSDMNAFLNHQLLHKKSQLKAAVESNDWLQYCYLHERPYRFNAFLEIQEKLDDGLYWEILSRLWTDSENLREYNVDALLRSDRSNRICMMDEEEQAFFANLPDQITVYRGHQQINVNGWSWTLDFHQAHKFAHRFKSNDAKVSVAKINKVDALACLLSRSEYEIIAQPTEIKDFNFAKCDEYYANLYKTAEETFALGEHSIHSKRHWQKVEDNVLKICEMLPDADVEVCRHFAILHDCKRENEFFDSEHGDRAATFVNDLWLSNKINLSERQMDKLKEALAGHNYVKHSADPTIGACWDADRLELLRVCIVPNVEFFSTAAGKQLIFNT